ncbi:hypothetical protein WAX74_17470 [Psychrobacillus sp. FJAT-51614]|uniref:RNA polymerase subunit sigma-70 n=1 Tax=Psychrobacillus mangrovi TaxID=3117745 RepID=A0ABU8F8T6_9BACI
MCNRKIEREHDNQEEKEIYLTEMKLDEFLGIPKEEIHRMFEQMGNREAKHKKN